MRIHLVFAALLTVAAIPGNAAAQDVRSGDVGPGRRSTNARGVYVMSRICTDCGRIPGDGVSQRAGEGSRTANASQPSSADFKQTMCAPSEPVPPARYWCDQGTLIGSRTGFCILN